MSDVQLLFHAIVANPPHKMIDVFHMIKITNMSSSEHLTFMMVCMQADYNEAHRETILR